MDDLRWYMAPIRTPLNASAAQWAERGLFILGLAILLHPVLSSRFYQTMDGPSHLYVASLMKDLWFGYAPADRLWEINPVPVPNSLGHVLLAFFLIPFEAPEALKALHVLYMFSIPVLLRLIALQQRHDAPPWSAHLAFPFMVAVPFTMGYYNLCLGVPLLLAVVWQWKRTETEPRRKRWFTLAILLVLLYFTHALPYALALFWIALHAVRPTLAKLLHGHAISELDMRAFRNVVGAMLPSLVLTAWYLIASEPAPPAEENLALSTRLMQIWRPFIIEKWAPELILWSASVALLVLVLLKGIGQRASKGAPSWQSLPGGIFIGTLFLMMLFADNIYGNGGDVLFRVSYIMHFTAVMLLSTVLLQARFGLFVSTVSIAITTAQMINRQAGRDRLAHIQREAYEAARAIPPGGTVSIIYFDWERTHVAELGLSGRNTTILSNYELTHDHFPLRFKLEHLQATKALPQDPLDAFYVYHTNVRGAELRSSEHVLVVGQPRNLREQELINLLDRELSATHTIGSVQGLVRVFAQHAL